MVIEYSTILQEWEREGLIERIEENRPQKKGHYLPHRPVFKAESRTTPLRPVFDASCRSYNGLSLNDYLEKGPNLLEKIPEILIRFREKVIGVLADIRKAFQMITVQLQDQDFLRFLWWDQTDPMKLTVFRHKRVVFGLNCSPFILGAVIDHHLNSVQGPAAEIAKTMARSFYMDNLVTSLSSQEEVQQFQNTAVNIMEMAKMDLREWEFNLPVSNSKEEKGTTTKVLGLVWDKVEDVLNCDVSIEKDLPRRLTKRIILSKIQQVFDPLGVYSPIFLPPKLLLQRSWELKIGWDSQLPEDMDREFRTWYSQIGLLSQIKIPRHIWFDQTNKNEIHVFCDASLRQPKRVTIPRLELLACVLGARLVKSISTALTNSCPVTLWTDSSTVMAWVLRFLDNARRIPTERGNLKVIELERAERTFPGKQAPKNGLKTIKSVEGLWRHNQKPIQTPGAALPTNRIGLGKPFEVTGVDLLGPLHLKGGSKVWVALFTCAVYRAIHLEIVRTLEANTFLLALKRFICRRGPPGKIYSDNGTNFSKTNELLKRLDWGEIERESSVKRIQWIFIPPSAPWWGGFWERLVRVVKSLLVRMLGFSKLNYVQLETALCEVESIINNRALSYISEDDQDLIPLTPQMFLQTNANNEFPELEKIRVNSFTRKYKILSKLNEELKQRFRKEYLGVLIQRAENKRELCIKEGDLVLIGQDNTKRILWPVGKIIKLYLGKDGVNRVARVKTSTGEWLRPVQRLFPLEISSEETPEKASGDKKPLTIKTRSGREVRKPIRSHISMTQLKHRLPTISVSTRGLKKKVSNFPPIRPHPQRNAISAHSDEPEFKPWEVLRAIHRCGKRKAPGPDGLGSKCLDLGGPSLQFLLAELFTKCLRMGHFPRQWKEGRLILLPKPSNSATSQLEKYRPITLMNTRAKVFERCILARLQRLADRHGWFFEDQYKTVLGTVNGRSAEDALASITQLIEERQAHWRKTLVISSDISKAFDTVWRQAIIQNLERLNCSESITCLEKSFLEDRTVSYSAWTATECTSSQLGTPQGSALSPFLWNIVARTIFTLPSIIDSRLISYADDFTLMTQLDGASAWGGRALSSEGIRQLRSLHWNFAKRVLRGGPCTPTVSAISITGSPPFDIIVRSRTAFLKEINEGNFESRPGPASSPYPPDRRQLSFSLNIEEITTPIIFTDGSKNEAGVGAAIVPSSEDQQPVLLRLHPDCTAFRAELLAIRWAVRLVKEGYSRNAITIASDCRSALSAICTSGPVRSTLLAKIILALNTNQNVNLCWVPGHCGIDGKERADSAAKNAAVLIFRAIIFHSA
ncbi:hypothetical protein LAZ67_3002993 [Cordylochernes scorpioides]|uniref:Uncharacterized protein n=1 Tax=Cordylochernes scorpioides TaxID=51811 RepID=A0ABY6KCU9_9ARAC|nr:hypothetical protein LAZ67_3002993 [Cordylochernes scorpioides]